jgi:GAF domain-containing protein
VDDEGTLGVLEVLDRRGGGAFDLRDIELATVFARQATVAIRSSRLERDTATILRSAIAGADAADVVATDAATGDAFADALEPVLAEAIRGVAGADDDPLWTLADRIARVRAADPDELELVGELLDVLVRRAERRRTARHR